MRLKNIGEIVEVNGHKGTVEAIKFKDGRTIYEVKFLNDRLCPPVMDVEARYLPESKGEDPNKCPVCKTTWTITKFNNKEWRDCVECNLTDDQAHDQADILSKKEKNDKVPPKINLDGGQWGIF